MPFNTNTPFEMPSLLFNYKTNVMIHTGNHSQSPTPVCHGFGPLDYTITRDDINSTNTTNRSELVYSHTVFVWRSIPIVLCWTKINIVILREPYLVQP